MATPPVLLVELFYDGVWNDVTADVYEGTVSITRGRASADSQAAPQSMQCTFKNTGGKYSPRNPMSPLFGKIGRNTPIRATVSGSSRFYGEVADWGPAWNENHTVKSVPVVANGPLRRMGQGSAPAAIGLRDYVLTQNPDQYWSLSGAEGTTYSVSLGLLGSRFYPVGSPIFTYGKDFPAADWLGTGMELTGTGASKMVADVSGVDTVFIYDFVFQSPVVSGQLTNMGVLDLVVTSYNGDSFRFRLQDAANSGKAQMFFTSSDGTRDQTDLAAGPFAALRDNALHTCRITIDGSSPTVYGYRIYLDGNIVTFGGVNAAGFWLGTKDIQFFYDVNAGQAAVQLAHFAVYGKPNLAAAPVVADYDLAAHGYAGETAAARVTRVAGAAGVPIAIVGTESSVMGPQSAETRLNQIRDAEATDFGILAESRTQFGLRYRTRTSMYNQAPAATLDYNGKQVAPPFQPIDDDQQIRNNVTVSRRGGGNYQLVKTTGSLSTQAPPNGVGPYEDSITVNLVSDEGLPAAAGWWLSQGTLDEPRFPQVPVNLAITEIGDVLASAVRAVDIGDLLRVQGMAAADIYSDVNLIVLGYTETVADLQHRITFNCVSATGYTFAKWGADAGTGPDRWDTTFSTLTSAISSGATSFQVSSPATALWTTNAAEFPFSIVLEGERMTVSNITGAASPQTFTVTRSVDGVVKAHPAGAPVRLFNTPRYGY